MRTIRVIPCLDVDARPGREGRAFVDLVDAGDPVELAARYDRRGRRRADLPRHHRVLTRAATPWWRWWPAPPSRCSSRSRSAAACAASRTVAACCGPGPRRWGSTRPPSPIRSVVRRAGRRVRVPVRRRGRRRRGAATRAGGWEVHTHGGRRPPGSTRWRGPSGPPRSAPARCCVTSMDRDGTRDGLRPRAARRRSRTGGRAGRRLGRRRHARAPGRGGDQGQGRRPAGGVDLPHRQVHDRRGQGATWPSTASPSARPPADAVRLSPRRSCSAGPVSVGRGAAMRYRASVDNAGA